jgi:hypothetical protein
LYEKDPELADIWQQKGDIKWGFYVWGGLLWKERPAKARLCVPQVCCGRKDLPRRGCVYHTHGADKVKILRHMHDANRGTAGHPDKHRTLAKVLGNYYWSGVYVDTVQYVASCHKCQLAKIDRHTELVQQRRFRCRPNPGRQCIWTGCQVLPSLQKDMTL